MVDLSLIKKDFLPSHWNHLQINLILHKLMYQVSEHSANQEKN